MSPVVACFCSEACDLTGELWPVGGGSVSRSFISLTDGCFKHPGREGVPTVEDVAEHLDTIRDEGGYLVGSSGRDEFTKPAPRMLG